MKSIISVKFAANLCIIIYLLFIIMHVAFVIAMMFFDFVPLDYVWGGQIETKQQLFVFELISIFIMAVCLFITLVNVDYISIPRLKTLARICMWILFLYFLMNTIGNLYAKSWVEKLFSVGSLPLSLLSLRLALSKS